MVGGPIVLLKCYLKPPSVLETSTEDVGYVYR